LLRGFDPDLVAADKNPGDVILAARTQIECVGSEILGEARSAYDEQKS
jgi:hypothetical protein